MRRKTPEGDGQAMRERIRGAAIDLFAARGYHGTSVRDLAQSVGIEAASLYYHYPSKQDLLLDLFEQIMDDLLDGLLQATLSEGDAMQRLRAVVRFHVLFHVARRKEAFVSHMELRSLTPENRRRIVAQRDRYEHGLRRLLEDGVAARLFQIDDVALTSTAILVMCSAVSDWIHPGGRLQPADVAEQYAELVLRLVAPGRSPVATAPAPSGSTAPQR